MNSSSHEHPLAETDDERPAAPNATGNSMVLCSLRIVPVSSEHYLGQRYVMELAMPARGRELRVYRSLDLLMEAVATLGIRADLMEGLYRDLCREGSCTTLDIVI